MMVLKSVRLQSAGDWMEKDAAHFREEGARILKLHGFVCHWAGGRLRKLLPCILWQQKEINQQG